MNKEKLNSLLDKIEGSLGHTSDASGIYPVFVWTDTGAIREAVEQIRVGMKSKSVDVDKDVFVTNEEIDNGK